MTQNKGKKKVRIPVFNGFVEISKEKYDKLIKRKRLDKFKSLYEPKTYTPTVDFCKVIHYSKYYARNTTSEE